MIWFNGAIIGFLVAWAIATRKRPAIRTNPLAARMGCQWQLSR